MVQQREFGTNKKTQLEHLGLQTSPCSLDNSKLILKYLRIMKVLWITNTLFPDVCNELKIEVPVVGGWMFSAALELLHENTTIQLAVATLSQVDQKKTFVINGITYFLLPFSKQEGKYNKGLESHWKEIQNSFQPDLVHIHGTEYSHGLAYINACGPENVVVSIQGLMSIIGRYYFSGIDKNKLRKNITLRDIIRRDSIFGQKKEFQKRGEIEKVMIQSVSHIIGRTAWDKAHSWSISPQANYHFCNETLRSEFYQHTWELSGCEKHSIFLSQAYYPIKGLQQIIKALPIILRHFPDTKIYVAGRDFVTNRGWRLNGFGKYIRSLMKECGVTDKIIFTGILHEKEMSERYIASHVFVCPSSIENSPNSVGEAQLLGVPCVAAYVGGIPDMISDNETGLLYRFEEIEMLAMSVCKIFDDDFLAQKISGNAIKKASIRHDKHQNAKVLSEIYSTISK
jgi:glycosyltransferase involved in cell wall biosynthesis